jgi:hypothetical protein
MVYGELGEGELVRSGEEELVIETMVKGRYRRDSDRMEAWHTFMVARALKQQLAVRLKDCRRYSTIIRAWETSAWSRSVCALT